MGHHVDEGDLLSEPFDLLLEKYARLVVRVGVNVQPGQEVVINALPEQADAARAIAARPTASVHRA